MLVRLKQLSKSQTFFCISVALLMVAARMIFYDYNAYFTLKDIPDEDMYQGASFFATNMHSMRIEGEIAWWNPIEQNNGYAQYYQNFLAPLAPTPSHIVFIVWAQIIYLLSLLNISVPEFVQYLIVNYIVLPFLYFVVLGHFLGLLFRRRATQFFIMTVCTFSYVGWVNSGWFYFQEPLTMFFVLGAIIAYLKRPIPRRLGWVFIAGLIQLTSFNYWTVFNFWFVLILLSVYIWLNPHQARRAYQRTLSYSQTHRLLSIALGMMIVITVLVWVVMLGSIFLQQSDNYERTLVKFREDVYQVENLQLDTPYGYSVQLFNPQVSLLSTYLGAFLIPLLVVLPAIKWRRLEKWWFAVGVSVLLISFAPPLAQRIWEVLPFMNRLRHFFYFYPLYWKLSLVILAGASLDTLLEGRLSPQEKRLATRLMAALMIGAGLALLGFDTLMQQFGVMERAHVGVVVLIMSVLLYRLLIDSHKKNQQLLITVLLILAFTDLSRHYWGFRQLESVTETRWQELRHNPKPPFSKDISQALGKAWSPLNPAAPYEAFDNMPLGNDIWPTNSYVRYNGVYDIFPLIGAGINPSNPRLSFHTEFDQTPPTETITKDTDISTILWLSHAIGSTVSQLEIGDNWHVLESGLQSGEVYRWVENDPEITVTTDPTIPERLRLEIEPGPGVENQPFTLELRTSDDVLIGQALVTNRQWVEFDLPPSENAVYHLHIEGGGKLANNGDTRVLNFRAMYVGLISRPDYNFLSNGHARPFEFEWGYFDYNTLVFNVDISQDGWLSLAQVYDPLWVITVDGKEVKEEQANFVRTAIPVEAGQHEIRLEYRPLARRLYWPASFLLEFTLVAIFIGLILVGKPKKLPRTR